MTEPSLFPDLEPVDHAPAESTEILSADRRRTLRQHADVERGYHPLTGGKLPAEGENGHGHTCGDCHLRVLVRWHNRTYAKCAFGIDPHTTPLDDAPRASHGAASDVRAWWPACRDWVRMP